MVLNEIKYSQKAFPSNVFDFLILKIKKREGSWRRQ